MLADEHHFLNQQCRAVGLGQLQRAFCLVQQLASARQRGRTAAAIDTILQRKVRIANCLVQLTADDRERIHAATSLSAVNDKLFVDARVTH